MSQKTLTEQTLGALVPTEKTLKAARALDITNAPDAKTPGFLLMLKKNTNKHARGVNIGLGLGACGTTTLNQIENDIMNTPATATDRMTRQDAKHAGKEYASVNLKVDSLDLIIPKS